MSATSGITVGWSASIERTFSEADVAAFATLTGDDNPLHLDPDYAARTRFGTPIVHGLLAAGLFGTLIGTRVPGPGAIYLSQSIRFLRPVRPGQPVTARVEVTHVRDDRPIVTLATTVTDAGGELVLSGEAVVLVEPPAG